MHFLFRIFLYSLEVIHTYFLRYSGWLIYTSGVLFHSLTIIQNRHSRENKYTKKNERKKIQYSLSFFLLVDLFFLLRSLSRLLFFSLLTTTTKKFYYTAVYVSVLDRLPTGVIIAVSIARSW
jgi:hypothetical protein